jgi:hypothetical protein
VLLAACWPATPLLTEHWRPAAIGLLGLGVLCIGVAAIITPEED